jgi:tetratricopeptide (TPR) repeat protein/predicted acylesterase/phospholipase RssA
MQSIKILSRFEKSFQFIHPLSNILNPKTSHNLKFIPTTIFDRISHLDEHYINEISFIQKHPISDIASMKQLKITPNSLFISGIKTKNIGFSHLIFHHFFKNSLHNFKRFSENEFLNISNTLLKIKTKSKVLKSQKKHFEKLNACNNPLKKTLQNKNLINYDFNKNDDNGSKSNINIFYLLTPLLSYFLKKEEEDDDENLFPLHAAAKKGDVELFKKLAKQIEINKKDKDGKTPLFIAIESGQEKIVKIIVKEFKNSWNTSCTLKLGKSDISFSPLSYCVKCGENKCLDTLITTSKEKISFQDNLVEKTGNLLHLAIRFGKCETLYHLLSKYKRETRDLIEKQNYAHQSPLMLAASLENKEAIYLLHKKGAKLESQDISKRTAMHYAALNRKEESIKSLFCLGAELSPKDKDGKTPYDLVKESKDPLSKNICSFLQTLIKYPDKKKKYSPFDFSFNRPHNLVFQGGGTKGFAYLGVIEVLEDEKMMKDVKRVAGTSAGAITATLLSMGYDSKKIKDLLQETPLTKFLDHPFRTESIKEIIKENTSINSLYKLILSPHELCKLVNPMTWIKKLWETTGLCEGEKFFEWVEKQVKEKTGIDHCTFGELKNLIDQGKPFKHLYIVGTKIGENPKIVTFNSEDPKWKDLVISNATTISGSFPGVFKPRILLFKDPDTKNLYKREDMGFFVDGGMLRNFPIEIFDKMRYILHGIEGEEKNEKWNNRSTLGCNLYSPEFLEKPPSNKEIKNVKDLVKGLFEIYLYAEILLRDKYNECRTIEINNRGAGTFEFNEKTQNLLILSGKRATHRFIQDAKRSFVQKDKIGTKAPHPDFIERKKYLKELQKKCIPSFWIPKTKATTRVLFGPGGVGKSELAKYFADKYRSNFSFVFPIASETKEKRDESYRDLAYMLHIYLEEKDSSEKIKKKVFNELENYSATKPWLLIYDNVTEEIEYPERGGSILITTRNKSFWNNSICKEIRPFTSKESQKLIENITNQKDIENIKALAKELGNFPLAITSAAYYIAEEGLTIEEYLKELKQEKTHLLKTRWDKNYSHSLQATWDITFKKVKKLYPKAFELLQLCAYFYPENIPQELVEEWISENKEFSNINRRFRSRNLLKTLQNYSLIYRDTKNKTFSFHRLMQEVLQKELQEEKNNSLYLKAVDLLAKKINEFDDQNFETWNIGKVCSLHSKWILKNSLSKIVGLIAINKMYDKVGNIENTLGNFEEAFNYYNQGLKMKYSIYGKDKPHPDMAKSLNNVGKALKNLENYQQAFNYCKQALEMRYLIYGKDKPHPDIAESLNDIGRALRRLCKHQESFNYFKQALDMRYLIYGRDKPHLDIAKSLNNIGAALYNLGKTKKSLYYYNKALKMEYLIHGKNKIHPDIAILLYNIGFTTLHHLKNYQQAFNYCKQSLEMLYLIYGKDKPLPVIVRVLNTLRDVLYNLKNYQQAFNYCKQALEMRYLIYGKDKPNPDIAESLNYTGEVLRRLCKHQESFNYFKQALDMQYLIYGKNKPHPDIANSLNDIGAALFSLGKNQESFSYLKQALEMYRLIYGKDPHLDIARSLSNVGTALFSLGKDQESFSYLKQALEMRYLIYGKDKPNPDIAKSLNDIGEVLQYLENYQEAFSYHKQALDMRYLIYGKNNTHPDIAKSLNNVGIALHGLGKTKKALSYCKQALDINYLIYSKDNKHPEIIKVLNLINQIQKELEEK